jgi:hypothetical protein
MRALDTGPLSYQPFEGQGIYRDGLGNLEQPRSLAGLFDPIHERRCFNYTQAGLIEVGAQSTEMDENNKLGMIGELIMLSCADE